MTDRRSTARQPGRHGGRGAHGERGASPGPARSGPSTYVDGRDDRPSRKFATSVDRADLTFIAAIGLSAFLLFTLELLAGRLVLPAFGGTPGVWATTLSFFTAVLFAGYLYAHVLVTRIGPRRGAVVHVGVAGLALFATIVAPRDIAALRQATLPEALNVLLVQALMWGPAAFLLAATTPLLSAWYARRGRDPWWLYATSNGASFVGLVAYPFVIEPTIGLAAQRLLLVAGLALFGAALVAIVRPFLRTRTEPAAGRNATQAPGRMAGGPQTSPVPAPAPITRRRKATWLLAAFVPAGLLSATTNFITTDLLSAPLLWVGPLAIYLLSFVIAFSTRGRRALRAAERLVPAAATLLWLPWLSPIDWPILGLLLVELGAFLVIAVAVHGRLALDRPDVRQLTTFYLVLSAGGMAATAFVALIAPLAFPAIYEYPLLIVAAIMVLGLLPGPRGVSPARSPAALLRDAGLRVVPFAVAAAVLLVLVAARDSTKLDVFLGVFAAGAVIVAIAVRPAALAVISAALIIVLSVADRTAVVLERRTFFGVLRVEADDRARAEFSGTTLHGFQFLDEARRRLPTTYYVTDGPLGQVLEDLRTRLPNPTIGVVGLGVGTTAAYAQSGDSLTFYEIDPATVEIARDTRYFSYLSDAQVTARIVIGDARLSLAQEPAGTFDILILDAFSSDAVPTHLLTREAVIDYARTLRPGGMLLFHVTNRYYRLDSAVIATTRAAGLGSLSRAYQTTSEALIAEAAVNSIWVLAGERTALPRFRALGWGDTDPGPVLTDDFADLLRALRMGSG